MKILISKKQDNTEPSRNGDVTEGVTVRTRHFNEVSNGSTSALVLDERIRDDLSRVVICGDEDKKPRPMSAKALVTKLGFIWAPYVPLQMTATFLDPADFSFRKGLRTRYAKKMA